MKKLKLKTPMFMTYTYKNIGVGGIKNE